MVKLAEEEGQIMEQSEYEEESETESSFLDRFKNMFG